MPLLIGMLVLLPGGTLTHAAVAPESRSAADPGQLQLRDQFGVMAGLRDDAASLQIAIVVSASRLRRLKPWERALREHDEDVPLIRVADVPRTAPTEYETVAAKLRQRLPEDLNVLIDLEGVWVQAFGLDSSVPNILLFDGAGQLLARHGGMYKKALFEALRADLERLQSSAGVAATQSP